LAAAGYAEPPTTWSALLEQARALRASGTDPHPVAFAPIEWTWAMLAASLGDPIVDTVGRPTFAEPDAPGRAAMGLLLTMLREELIAPEIRDEEETQHSWFWGGRGTFHQGWAGSLPAARHPSGGRGDAVTYLTLPDTGRTVGVPRGFAIPAGAPDPEAARTFLAWILRPEIQRELYLATGVIPARRSVTEALVAEGRVADGATLLAQLGNVGRMPSEAPAWPALSERIAAGIADAAADGTSADALIDAIAADWDRVPPAACAA
ncbi:MAG: extracellular solute-binding protein, partial [Chloroflexota bacterium]